LKGLAGELAANTAAVDFDGQRLRLALGGEHAHLGAERYRQRLEQAVGTALDRRVRIELVEPQAATPASETPADADARRAESQRAAAREAIDSDPVVAAFRERFDAQVQPGTIEPAPDARGDESQQQ